MNAAATEGTDAGAMEATKAAAAMEATEAAAAMETTTTAAVPPPPPPWPNAMAPVDIVVARATATAPAIICFRIETSFMSHKPISASNQYWVINCIRGRLVALMGVPAG